MGRGSGISHLPSPTGSWSYPMVKCAQASQEPHVEINQTKMVRVAASTTSVLFKLCAKNSMCFLTHFSRVLAWWHPYYHVASCSLQCPDGLWVQHQAAALLTHGFFPLSVPGGVRIHTHIHKEGEEDRHESLCWKQQSIFILPSSQRQSSTSALLGSGSTRRRAALGWRSLRLRERLSTFPYCILFSAQGI